MANEISVAVSASITQSGQTVNGDFAFTASLSGTSYIGEEVTIGSSSAAALYLSGLTDPVIVMLANLDTANFITVDSAVTLDKFPQKIDPGQGILLMPQTGIIYAKADTAPVKAFVVAG